MLIIGLYVNAHSAFGKDKEKGEIWRSHTTMLPQYCKDRAADKKLFLKKWRKTFGEASIHMHHYCGGVYAEQQARSATSSGARQKLLGTVIHQMGYVSNHCPTGCVLYPELHTRWAWALGEKGQAGEAIKHYNLVLKSQPKYTLAYARLADLYADLKQPDEAKKILRSGLKQKPNSRILKRRLEELETQE